MSILIDKTKTFFSDEAQGYTDVKVPGEKFKLFSGMSPFVRPEDCFDALFIPKDHVSRRPTDTYYQSKDVCLRTHTSVHQIPIIKDNNNAFLVMGDVYRKDTVDRTHYPAFHQMEGVRIFDIKETFGTTNPKEAKLLIEQDLKAVLEKLARHIFGDVEMRWNTDYFPFTDPSLELEIYYNNEWLEILGCGVIYDGVMTNGERDPLKECGWAFGLGLERWAMKLFEIDDIRLFWSKDPRFLS